MSTRGKLQEERNAVIREQMLDLEEVKIIPMPDNSPWIEPIRMNYRLGKHNKSKDMIKSPEGVAIILFNITRKKLIFVKQFRAVYYLAILPENTSEPDVTKYPAELGLTLELCAGMVDKDKSLVEIARDEVREECGYEAPASAFEKISTYRSLFKFQFIQLLLHIF